MRPDEKNIDNPMDKKIVDLSSSFRSGQSIATTTNSHPPTTFEFADHVPWFFFWKHHPSQWAARLETMKQMGTTQLIIPLSWSHHAIISDRKKGSFHYDFGKERSDTDLFELMKVLKKYSFKPFFCLPIGPLPYLVNGGVPSSLVKNKTFFRDGRLKVFVDHEKNLQSFPSFYGAQIFKEFCAWIQALSNHLTSTGWDFPIYGINCGYFSEQGNFLSFFEDHGVEMQKKFLQHRKQFPLMTEKNFAQEVFQLYLEVSKEMLGGALWSGEYKMSFLGVNPEYLSARAVGFRPSESTWMQEMKWSLQHQVHPILPTHSPAALNYVHQVICSADYVKNYFKQEAFDGESLDFRTWSAAAIIGQDDQLRETIKVCGLGEVLNKNFQGHFQILSESQLKKNLRSPDEEEDWWSKVLIVMDHLHQDASFLAIMNHFLSGGKVLLNLDKLNEKQKRKIELLILENQLKETQFNSPVEFRLLTRGEGQLILYVGSALEKIKLLHTKTHFWSVIFAQMNRHFLAMKTEDGPQMFWLERKTSPRELNYQSIRRLLVINATEFDRKIQLSPSKNFALSKIVDQSGVQVIQQGQGTRMEFAPGARALIEFGYVE
ncbi:MAG: hypothetical protein QE271_09110 [Bacteriovoracaceae bacterium]|nr:hypothetical protein [Bacteriovoracaceae bacterium]